MQRRDPLGSWTTKIEADGDPTRRSTLKRVLSRPYTLSFIYPYSAHGSGAHEARRSLPPARKRASSVGAYRSFCSCPRLTRPLAFSRPSALVFPPNYNSNFVAVFAAVSDVDADPTVLFCVSHAEWKPELTVQGTVRNVERWPVVHHLVSSTDTSCSSRSDLPPLLVWSGPHAHIRCSRASRPGPISSRPSDPQTHKPVGTPHTCTRSYSS